MASGGILGLGILSGSGGGLLGGSGAGTLGATITGPIQKRLTALQGAGTIQAKLQGALAASPLGARLKTLGTGGLLGGTGTGTDRRPLRHLAEPYRASDTPNPRQPNNNFLSHF